MSKRHHNKDKKANMENIPEIFKDLWGFNFIEEVGFSKVKNETPRIRIVVAREDEGKIETIKTLLQKYEFPFSNLKIVLSGDKKESETKAPESSSSLMSRMNKPADRENGKPNNRKIIGGKKPPPFHCI